LQRSEKLIKKLRDSLAKELPGIKSWERMAVKSQEGNSIESESLQKYSKWLTEEKLSVMKTAAVLIGFFEKGNRWYFPLIKRPMHEKNHPGQIALPGGARENNETLEETALREAFEEVGIIPNNVEIIGKLTPLPVPVSNYLIYPFVGIINKEPEWKINKDEVAELIILKLDDLIEADNGYSENWDLRGNKVKVPVFKLSDRTIWGATATVLCEMLDLIK
jgi:8-oxo-dGTP pyrophosphatase MutT (NUDIX family)